MTKHLPEEEEVDRRTKSAGKVSFSLTITISPTWKIKEAVYKTAQEITEKSFLKKVRLSQENKRKLNNS